MAATNLPRQLGAVLDVLGLEWDSLFVPKEAGENRNKVVQWLYRILDTLDSKTSHLVSFSSMLLAAQTFLGTRLLQDTKSPLWMKITDLLLLLVPLTTAVYSLGVFNVTWQFFGKVRGENDHDYNQARVEEELRLLATVSDERFQVHRLSLWTCRLSVLAFVATLVLELLVVLS